MKIISILVCSFLLSVNSFAKEITQDYKGISTQANLVTASDNWQASSVVLLLHGTIAHNKMEIIAALQNAFKDNEITSLAINLSLGLNNRKGMYPCATPHTHKHTDSLEEIDLWLNWLKKQGAKSVILMGHSRGGNQIAWYASEHNADNAITQVVLLAPGIVEPGELAKEYNKKYKTPLKPILDNAKSLIAAGKGKDMLKDIDFIYCAKTSATADAFVNYYQENKNFNTAELVKKIEKPVIVIAGSEDTVSADVEDKMAEAAELDNVKLHTIDGADHFFRDLYIEEVLEIIMDN
ncbi:MAG: alpha/beta hydrolase [Gammaproteobacteria bacterium]|nr:alpha/beta hydrolase [Gammaproteobacteria bacterium]